MLDERRGIDDDNRVQVMDFGLAARLGVQDSRLTLPGMIVGTPQYLPPEHVPPRRDTDPDRTAEISVSTDIYGLGAILYELLAGVPPF